MTVGVVRPVVVIFDVMSPACMPVLRPVLPPQVVDFVKKAKSSPVCGSKLTVVSMPPAPLQRL